MVTAAAAAAEAEDDDDDEEEEEAAGKPPSPFGASKNCDQENEDARAMMETLRTFLALKPSFPSRRSLLVCRRGHICARAREPRSSRDRSRCVRQREPLMTSRRASPPVRGGTLTD